jgi:hypothetical protein
MKTIGAPVRNISRAKAKELGLKRYNGHVPCPNGHVSDKLVSNYTCIQCLRIKLFAKRKIKRAAEQTEKKQLRDKLRGPHHLPATAMEAKEIGLKRYFTGLPCPRGHISDRYTGSSTCVECVKVTFSLADAAKFKKDDPDAKRAYNANRAKKLRASDVTKARAKQRKKYRSDIQHKLRSNLRSRIKHALNGHTKNSSALVYLGCTVFETKTHLESLFLPGMHWSNHALHGWHIDHIIPLSSFDMRDEEQRKKAFHYSNLQPLWATHNQIKGSRHAGKSHRSLGS